MKDAIPESDRVSGFEGLIAALRRLDALLHRLASSRQTESAAGTAPFRGLYVNAEEAAQLLARDPCAPSLTLEPNTGLVPEAPSPLHVLAEQFGLSAFDLDVESRQYATPSFWQRAVSNDWTCRSSRFHSSS
jgi:hypothetical protein